MSMKLLTTLCVPFLLLASCTGQTAAVEFETVEAADTFVAEPRLGRLSPRCTAAARCTFVKARPDAPDGEAIARINRDIARLFTDKDVPVAQCAEAYVAKHIADYRETVPGYWRRERGGDASEDALSMLRSRYSYDHSISSSLEMGRAGELLCLRLFGTDYWGGVHPMSHTVYRTYLLRTGDVVTPDNLFRADARDELVRRIVRKIKTNPDPDAYREVSEELVDVPDDMLVTRDKIVFVFQLYEIAPYSAGFIKAEFGYGELKDLMAQ